MASNQTEIRSKNLSRAEGWLNVWEIDRHADQRLFEEGKTPKPVWEPHFCVLSFITKKVTHFRTEKAAEELQRSEEPPHKVRIDGGKDEFDRRWGYLTLESIKENVMQHSPLSSLEAFSRTQTLDNRSISSQGSCNSAYEKSSTLDDRRGSVPMMCSQQPDPAEDSDPPATPSRLASFFSRKVIKSNLKRTKSVTKLDRKRNGLAYANDVEGSTSDLMGSLKRTMSLGRLTKKWQSPRSTGGGAYPLSPEEREKLGTLINNRMRTSRSHESLLMSPSSMHAIDLSAADLEIKPLHSSILGQDHCFQVSTANGSKYYSCRSAEERQRWIQHLRKAVQPCQEQSRRTENSLQIWVLEAKNLPAKKRYFCEVCLDKTLYARTSIKSKGDMLFWGEHFDFSNLPTVETVTVSIYREADKKKKKEKNAVLGYIHIPVSSISGRQLSERWYTASSATVGKAGRDSKSDLPLIRIKARYQTVNILPMDAYSRLTQYLSRDYAALVEVLEPQISVKTKDELASILVRVLQKLGIARDFLSDIVMTEVLKLENENLAFRGNSIATKSMEAYMKLIGDKYLQDTLGDFVKTVLETGDECEVDPTRVQNNSLLQRNQTNLIMYCEMAWFKIINSHCFFPIELKEVFRSLSERCHENKREETVSATLISACIFLRFLCPAILSPSLFNLTQEFPHERAARNLTLIAKTIQNLANFTKFGGKEEFMTFMNDFVEREFPAMQTFVTQISTISPSDQKLEFDGYIDLGRELSVLHTLLLECLDKLSEAAASKLTELKSILQELTEAVDNPNTPLMRHRTPGTTPSSPLAPISDNIYSLAGPGSKDAGTGSVRWSSDSVRQRTNPANLQSTDDLVMFHLGEGAPVEHLGPSVGPLSGQRPDEKQLNMSWDKIVSAAEMVNGEYVDLINFMDDFNEHRSVDGMSVGQNSTIASSGYQSHGGCSQSNSPVESLSAAQDVVMQQVPLSFANPLFGHSGSLASTPRAGPGTYRSPSSSSLSSDEGSRRLLASRQLSSHSACSASESLPHRSHKQGGRGVFRVGVPVGASPRCHSASSPSVHRRDSNLLTSNELSKSIEFSQLRQSPGSPGMKRTVTDTVLIQSEFDPAGNPALRRDLTASAPPVRRNLAPLKTGAKPALHRRNQSADVPHCSDYEKELQRLQHQLSETQAMLSATQDRLSTEQLQRDQLASSWQMQLQASEERLNVHTRQKDEQMKDIISRLITVEGELRKEQMELQTVVSEKQQIIEAQEQRIQALDAANNRLLAALNQLKEKCQSPSTGPALTPTGPAHPPPTATPSAHNGIPPNPQVAKLTLQSENGHFRSSTC